MNRSPWSSVKSQSREQRVGVTPRPSPVPAGAPRPWEGSVKGGGGSSRTEPSVFLSCVGGSDLVSASGSPALPPPLAAQPHGEDQRQGRSLGSARLLWGCTPQRWRWAGVVLANLCRMNAPASGHRAGRLSAKEGLCCGAEPVRQRLWGTHACWRVHGAVTVAKPTQGRGAHSTHAPVWCPQPREAPRWL